MLTLTRKEGESILISLSEDADPNLTLADLFANGPLALQVKSIKGKQVSLGFDAPKELLILRQELQAV